MFLTSNNSFLTASILTKSNSVGRAIATGVDIVIDFATLGEYRVVTGEGASSLACADTCDRDWAVGIEWSVPERTRAVCSLPRARDRELARSRVYG